MEGEKNGQHQTVPPSRPPRSTLYKPSRLLQTVHDCPMTRYFMFAPLKHPWYGFREIFTVQVVSPSGALEMPEKPMPTMDLRVPQGMASSGCVRALRALLERTGGKDRSSLGCTEEWEVSKSSLSVVQSEVTSEAHGHGSQTVSPSASKSRLGNLRQLFQSWIGSCSGES